MAKQEICFLYYNHSCYDYTFCYTFEVRLIDLFTCSILLYNFFYIFSFKALFTDDNIIPSTHDKKKLKSEQEKKEEKIQKEKAQNEKAHEEKAQEKDGCR